MGARGLVMDATTVLWFVLGGATGIFAGTLLGALAMKLYCDQRRGKEMEAAKQEVAKVYFDLGLQTGKNQIESRVYFRTVGFFRPRLEHLHVVYDAHEGRVKSLSGYYANYQLFASIPPEIKKAIGEFLTKAVKQIAA
jgi:hypothetical protein